MINIGKAIKIFKNKHPQLEKKIFKKNCIIKNKN